jgi:SOS response regulatory protein OraA/RecX
MIQRDFAVDGGLVPVEEEEVIRVRQRAGKAMQALFEELNFAPISDEEIEAAVYAYSSYDIIDRSIQNDIRCAEIVLDEKINGIDIAYALNKRGFTEESEAVLALLKQRVAADYLQPASYINDELKVKSIINDKNNYTGPGTAFVPDSARAKRLNDNIHITTFHNMLKDSATCAPNEEIILIEDADAEKGKVKDEVVIMVSPSFGDSQKKTLGDVSHLHVLDELTAGIEEEGISARCIKCYESSDLGVLASIGAKLSGSGIGIGVQSKGTSVITQADFSPLFNLELFSQAPLLDREAYREIGKSAAKYAKGEIPAPQAARIDPIVHPALIKSAILHHYDTNCVIRGKAPVVFTYAEKEATK